MTKTIAKILLILLATLPVLSCTKESTETLYAAQEARIDAYVKAVLQADESSQMFVTYPGNTTKVIATKGHGEGLKKGGSVSFKYAGYTLPGTALQASNMFATNILELAEEAKWDIQDPTEYMGTVTVSPSEKDLVKGLAEGLIGIQSGEECIILFTGKYGFTKKYGTISANSALAYYIKVESISN